MTTPKAKNVKAISIATKNNWNHPSTVNIGWTRANFLNFDLIKKKSQILGKHKIMETNGHCSVNIHWIWVVSIVLGSFWSRLDISGLKSCHRIGKTCFWAFQKINHLWPLDGHLLDSFF